MAQLVCVNCGKEIQIGERVGFREACIHCNSDIHSCRNCEFYDPKTYNECREPSAERVLEKEKSNFCDFYAPRTGGTGGKGKSAADLRAQAEALFKKK
jgi:hypothetical protein